MMTRFTVLGMVVLAGLLAVHHVAVAQVHPDLSKTVIETKDNASLVGQSVKTAQSAMTTLQNLKYFNQAAASSGAASAGMALAQSTVQLGATTAAASNTTSVGSAAQKQEEKAKPLEIGQVKVSTGQVSGPVSLLESTLPHQDLPPIVPTDISKELGKETPDAEVIKAKLAELILLDKSSPKKLQETQDAQNRLLAAATLRTLDNAKRSFDLSEKGKDETQADKKRIESAETFTDMLKGVAVLMVHTHQKINEMMALYAQLMEVESFTGISGAAQDKKE